MDRAGVDFRHRVTDAGGHRGDGFDVVLCVGDVHHVHGPHQAVRSDFGVVEVAEVSFHDIILECHLLLDVQSEFLRPFRIALLRQSPHAGFRRLPRPSERRAVEEHPRPLGLRDIPARDVRRYHVEEIGCRIPALLEPQRSQAVLVALGEAARRRDHAFHVPPALSVSQEVVVVVQRGERRRHGVHDEDAVLRRGHLLPVGGQGRHRYRYCSIRGDSRKDASAVRRCRLPRPRMGSSRSRSAKCNPGPRGARRESACDFDRA
mmetsp:Transcript_18918/g.54804  ORF Transcript_18918/g.54804 Transcript_18918/m.54804 type:complete len:262 (-) Transcript_18918:201-986(-)